MEPYQELLEMGFSPLSIEQALAHGCSSTMEAVDFLCNSLPSSTSSPPNPLRLPRKFNSQFGQAGLISAPISSSDCPQSSLAEEPQPEANPVQSRYKLLQPSFTAQQDEARKLAAQLREEKRLKAQERERLRRELEDDKLKRAARGKSSERSTEQSQNAASTTSDTSQAATELLIRVTLPITWECRDKEGGDRINSSSIIRLPSASATLDDLATVVQSRLDSVASGCPHEHPTLTLPCIAVFTSDWPRSRLQLTRVQRDGELTGSSLLTRDLGFARQIGLIVDHAASECGLEASSQEEVVRPSAPVTPSADQQDEAALDPNDHQDLQDQVEVDEAFENAAPEQDYRPITPPQVNLPPGLSRTPGRSGAAAIWRANKPRPAAGSYTTRHPAPPSNTPGPLVELCTRRLVDLIGRAVEGGARADIHSTLDRIAAAEGQGHGVLGANYTLRSMAFAWPENLGAELVRRLRTVGLFNSRTALLLRNAICRLNLSADPLITSELVICIAHHWTSLLELRLDGLQLCQVSSYAVEQLGKLQLLRVLHMDSLTSLNNQTIEAIAGLPSLVVLRASRTGITDAGWRSLLAKHEANDSPTFCPAPLRFLGIGGCDGFTDVGLAAVVQLFPRLSGLAIGHTEVTGVAPLLTGVPPLAALVRLDVTGCERLFQLPSCLTSRGSNPGSLRRVQLQGCLNLRLDRLLSQLEGQPIEMLDGFPDLPQISPETLRLLTSKHFPLRELHLPVLTLPPGQLTLSLLTEVLRGLSNQAGGNGLRALSLPMKPIACADADEATAFLEVLCRLGPHLTSLSVGGLASQLTREQLGTLAQHLRLLSTFAGENIGPEKEEQLRRYLPTGCRIRIRYLMGT